MRIRSLSEKEEVILNLLAQSGNRGMYGLQLVDESGKRLKRGTVYVTLSRMEDSGLIESQTRSANDGEKGPPRRLYKITAPGRQVFDAWRAYVHATRQVRRLAFGGIR